MIPALLLFLFPLAWSPGPGNLAFAANAARFGVPACMPSLFGYHLATFAATIAVAAGAAPVLGQNSGLGTMARLAGATYVLWLAFGLWRSAAAGSGTIARPMGFVGGAALLILNPKAWVIIALMITQFGTLISPPMMAAIFTANNLVAFAGWMLAGRGLSRIFSHPRHGALLNKSCAVMLAAVAIWMAIP